MEHDFLGAGRGEGSMNQPIRLGLCTRRNRACGESGSRLIILTMLHQMVGSRMSTST